jgi:hypothetical protein
MDITTKERSSHCPFREIIYWPPDKSTWRYYITDTIARYWILPWDCSFKFILLQQVPEDHRHCGWKDLIRVILQLRYIHVRSCLFCIILFHIWWLVMVTDHSLLSHIFQYHPIQILWFISYIYYHNQLTEYFFCYRNFYYFVTIDFMKGFFIVYESQTVLNI